VPKKNNQANPKMAKFDPLLACANTLFLQARPHFFFDTA